jgi:hypothetical protein
MAEFQAGAGEENYSTAAAVSSWMALPPAATHSFNICNQTYYK